MKPEFTVPPPIIEALAKGLREMDKPPAWFILTDKVTQEVKFRTDAGDVLTFLRGPEMGP